MKFSISLALLGAFFLSSCTDFDEPPGRTSRRVARYPQQDQIRQQPQYPPDQQPFSDGAVVPPGPIAPPDSAGREESSAPLAAPEKIVKGDYPYGVPVPGKPGFVKSPFSPDKLTDVRGIPPGTPVKDPYTDKVFLVP